MQPLIFDFAKPPKEVLFDYINRTNDLNLFSSDYQLGLPVSHSRTHTYIDIAPSCHNPQKGIVTFEYHRNDLEAFFFGVNPHFYTNDVIDIERVCGLIYDKYRVFLDPDEFTLESVTLGVNEPYVVKLKANPESLLWVGEMGVWVLPDNHLNELLMDYGISKPFNEQCINGYLYSQEYSFTDVPDDVISYLGGGFEIHTNDLASGKLINYLTDKTQDPWQITPNVARFNLYQAMVIKHTEDLIVLNLSPYCQNVFGILIFHKETT